MKVMIGLLLLLPCVSGAMDTDALSFSSDSTPSSPLSSPRPYGSPRKSRSCLVLAAAQKVRFGEGNDSPERCSPRGRNYFEELKKRRALLQAERTMLESDENACLEKDFEIKALDLKIYEFEEAPKKTAELLQQIPDNGAVITRSLSRTLVKKRASVRDIFPGVELTKEDKNQ